MTTDLETRLRRTFTALDDVPLPPFDPSAARTVTSRAPRHRTGVWLTVAAATVVLLGGVGMWYVAGRPDADPTTASSTPTDPEGAAPSRFADGLALIFDVRPVDAGPTEGLTGVSTVWADGRAIVFGGAPTTGVTSSTVTAFEPDSQRWSTLASLPTHIPPTNHIAVATDDAVIVVGGGQAPTDLNEFTDDQRSMVTARYDLASDTWEPLRDIPVPTNRNDPWAFTGDALYVWPYGGTPFELDLDTGQWGLMNPPPGPTRSFAASVWTGWEWIVWGGVELDPDAFNTGTVRGLDDGLAYDPASGQWRSIAEAPIAGRQAPGVWNGAEMIVAGGRMNGGSLSAVGGAAAYNPTDDTWRELADGPQHPGLETVAVDRYLVGFFKGRYVTFDPDDGDRGRWNAYTSSDVGIPLGDSVWTGDRLLVFDDGWGAGAVDMFPMTQPPCPAEHVGEWVAEPSDVIWDDLVMLPSGLFGRDGDLTLSPHQLGPPVARVCFRLADMRFTSEPREMQWGDAGELAVGTELLVIPGEDPARALAAILADGTIAHYSLNSPP